MNLKIYFDSVKGIGVLSTSDINGKVNAAIFSKPHIFADDTLGLIMRDRLTYHNLQTNPHAAYLFIEEGTYQGKRLYLTKISQEKDTDRINLLKRRKSLSAEEDQQKGPKYLLIFKIDKILPLIGSGEN
ncbi:MAG: pyridoxamine 5'-phosphate oxidase family protein [Desulfobacterales bacterium]|nr:pyridoxamine 5'-phosphate oxidase family protein [Desulfobacterales bacterium]